jgi:hypothetical protein
MSNRLKLLPTVSVILLLIAVHSVLAGIRPSFNLDSCVWHATHIVLVETTSTDDVFTVEESWKGNLMTGDILELPALKPESDALPISRYPEGEPFDHTDEYGVSGRIPRQPLGSKMVLFLKRRQEQDTPLRAATYPAMSNWQPVYPYGGFKLSVIWIDNGQPFCFQQWMNPGPSSLSNCWQRSQMDLPRLNQRVRNVLQTQDALARIVELEDRGARAERLEEIVYKDVYDARLEALQALGKTGPSALPTIRKILDNPPVPYDSMDLIRAFEEAAGEDAGQELTERLRHDLAYWQATGHTLKKGWWNQDATPQAPLREKYDETIQLIRALDHVRYRPAARTAAELRDLWISLPQLNDASGLTQMAQECDQLVRHLRVK